MIKCEDCGEIFDEADVVMERHPYGMSYAIEYWAVCPWCRSVNIMQISTNRFKQRRYQKN